MRWNVVRYLVECLLFLKAKISIIKQCKRAVYQCQYRSHFRYFHCGDRRLEGPDMVTLSQHTLQPSALFIAYPPPWPPRAPSLPYLTFLVLSWFSLPLIVSYSASFIVNLIHHHCLSSLYICPFVLCQYSVVVWRILSVVRSVPVVILVHSGSHIITQISGHCRPTSSSALQCVNQSSRHSSLSPHLLTNDLLLVWLSLEQRIQRILLLLLLFLTQTCWQIRSKKARRPQSKLLNWRRWKQFPELCCVGPLSLSGWVNDAVEPF